MTLRPGGIAARIALAALVVAGLAIAILAVGVMVIGGQSFADLMSEHGESTESSRAMFADSVGWVIVATSLIAVLVAVTVASVLGARCCTRSLTQPRRCDGRTAASCIDPRTGTTWRRSFRSVSSAVLPRCSRVARHCSAW